MKADRRTLLALVLILAAAAFLRFYALDRIILYDDEPLHQVRISYQPFGYAYAYNDGSPFLTLVIHGLLGFLPIATATRLAPAVFGWLAVFLTWRLGRTFLRDREALAGAALTAFAPFLIRFSQYGRAYGTLLFFALLALLLLFRALDRGRTRDWAAFAAAAAAMIFNHILTLFLLPAFGLIAALTWLHGWGRTAKFAPSRLDREDVSRRRIRLGILGPFVLWTGAALLAAALLYLPDITTRDYVRMTMQNRSDVAPESPASFGLVDDILRQQLEFPGAAAILLLVALAALGFAALARRHALRAVSLVLVMITPFAIFILIRANEVTVLSADRYFQFALPILFLLSARGMGAVADLAARGVAGSGHFQNDQAFRPEGQAPGIARPRLEASGFHGSARRSAIYRSTAAVLAAIFTAGLIMALHGPGLKSYHQNTWRLSAYALPGEVEDIFRRNARADAFLYIDEFPVSDLSLVLSPLSRDLRPGGNDVIIRDGVLPEGPERPVMIYRLNRGLVDWFAHSDVEFWTVTRLDEPERRAITEVLANASDARVHAADGFTVLHFPRNGTSLAAKMLRMTALLLALDRPPSREKDLRLLRTMALLRHDEFEPAEAELARAEALDDPEGDAAAARAPGPAGLLDRLGGFSAREVREAGRERLRTDIAYLLFRQGNTFAVDGDPDRAARAYAASGRIAAAYRDRAARRLEAIGRNPRKKGDGPL